MPLRPGPLIMPIPFSPSRLRSYDPTQPLARLLFYRLCYTLVLVFFIVVYRARFFRTHRVPPDGGLIVIANHQSHLDPPLLGAAVRSRHVAPIAREGLFRVPILGPVLRGVGCISIKETEGDTGAMRQAIAALKAGRVVVIFPEGSRSIDGRLHEFKRGVWLLLTRSGARVLPAAVHGCFNAWPRSRPFPDLLGHRLSVAFGEVIEPEALKAMGPDTGLAHLRNKVRELVDELEAREASVTPHQRAPSASSGI